MSIFLIFSRNYWRITSLWEDFTCHYWISYLKLHTCQTHSTIWDWVQWLCYWRNSPSRRGLSLLHTALSRYHWGNWVWSCVRWRETNHRENNVKIVKPSNMLASRRGHWRQQFTRIVLLTMKVASEFMWRTFLRC